MNAFNAEPVRLALLLASVAIAHVAKAQDVGQHPAVFSPRSLPAVNPSTFIVAHPASLSWLPAQAHRAHAAAVASGHSGQANPDTLLVPARAT